MSDVFERRKEHQGLLEGVDRQNWHLWLLSFCVILCLTLAFASFFYPAIRWHVDRLEVAYGFLPQLIVGLLTMVLLCIIYITLKQRELNELRNFLIATNLEARRLREELPRDVLTGVLDRRALPDLMRREVTWVDRYRVPLSLLLFNVRAFSKINAAQGNLAGDEILKVLARSIEATARQTDTILRYGPDRFLCFLPRTDLTGAAAFARRVNEACRLHPRLQGVALSFGTTEYNAGGNPDQILVQVEHDLSSRSGSAPPPAASSTAAQAR
jgi:diguanylate cyclase (GGDEF)-like protein